MSCHVMSCHAIFLTCHVNIQVILLSSSLYLLTKVQFTLKKTTRNLCVHQNESLSKIFIGRSYRKFQICIFGCTPTTNYHVIVFFSSLTKTKAIRTFFFMLYHCDHYIFKKDANLNIALRFTIESFLYVNDVNACFTM